MANLTPFDGLSYLSSCFFFGISLDNCSILRIKILSCLCFMKKCVASDRLNGWL